MTTLMWLMLILMLALRSPCARPLTRPPSPPILLFSFRLTLLLHVGSADRIRIAMHMRALTYSQTCKQQCPFFHRVKEHKEKTHSR